MRTFLILLCTALPIFSAERAALIIGNNAYQNATPLQTAAPDAQSVWENLSKLGYAAGEKPVLNASLETTVEAVEAFKLRARGATAAIVYFAGHGIEHEGVNYLIPVDATLEKAVQLKIQAYSLNTLLAEVKSLQVPTRLVILDCCRNNPLPERTWTRGDSTLADIADESLGGATMVVFSAAPGTKAKDRMTPTDPHSPFAQAFLNQLAIPGQNVFSLFGEVERNLTIVTKETQKSKVRFNGDISPFSNFLLNSNRPAAATINPPMALPTPIPASTEPLDNGEVGKVFELKLPKGTTMKFCYCPEGSFTMGSPKSEKGRVADEDQVLVRISKGFWMAQTECTQGQWMALMESNLSKYRGNDLPVEGVNWNDIQIFLAKMRQSVTLTTGWRAALPTEAQWEYACRAGTTGLYSFGNNGSLLYQHANIADINMTDYAWGDKTQNDGVGNTTAKVARYAANPWGIYDMHGNVWEWCSDWYGEKLPGGTDPKGAPAGTKRVDRGGSWYDPRSRNLLSLRHPEQ